MKRKIGMEMISKELLISAGIGVIIGLLVLSYASNNNLSKIESITDGPLALLAGEIISAYPDNGITNKGIANSLASKVMAANKALDKEDTETAIQKLNELITQINDRNVKHITDDEAGVLIGLAEEVIDMLSSVSTQECEYMLHEECVEGACRDPLSVECLNICNPDSEYNCIVIE